MPAHDDHVKTPVGHNMHNYHMEMVWAVLLQATVQNGIRPQFRIFYDWILPGHNTEFCNRKRGLTMTHTCTVTGNGLGGHDIEIYNTNDGERVSTHARVVRT